MSLTIMMGRAGSGKTHYCLEQIRSRLRQSPEGHPLLLLLPEHATFEIERQLAATPDIGGFARVHVVGFRRLAHRVLLETGGAVRPHITDLGKKLVLSRLMLNQQKELKVFHRAANQRTFAETLAGMIKEFKTYSITADQLTTVQETVGDSPLADKLHDLALLFSGFNDQLQGRYTDPEDYLSLLAAKIPQSVLLQGAEVWVDGFTWFNPREITVLTQILRSAADVTVTLCLFEPDLPEHQLETGLFHRQWVTRCKLRQLARDLGVEVREAEQTGGGRFAETPLLKHIERQFFAFPPAVWQGENGGIAIVEAANRRIEVEGIARDIIRLCRDKGYRWRDIAILLRDAENYSELVETVLADYDIPFFSDRQRQPVHHPLAELLRSALETLSSHWSYDPIFRCLKTDLFPVSRGKIDELENYVLEFGIRGTRWASPDPWTFVRRLALDEEAETTPDQQKYLERVNDIRRRAVAPLVQLEEKIKKATTVKEITVALYELLVSLDVPDKLSTWADKAEQDGDLEQAREHRQMWDSVVQLLEELVETCGDETISVADYAAILGDGLEGLTLSLIPPGLDHVTVSPLVGCTVANMKAVYIPGVNDGVLPMRGRSEGILTDADRLKMAAAGVELAPGATADTFAERFVVYIALTRAREYLWVSYPLADEEGKGLSPSLIISRLKELTRAAVASLPLEPAPGTEQKYLVHPGRSLAALAGGLRLYKSGKEVSPLWWDLYNWTLTKPQYLPRLQRVLSGLFHYNQEVALSAETADKLYCRRQKLRGSVTRFESFRACPFKHFAQYGLSLKERAVFRLKAPDLGQFFHAALKAFGDRMQAAGRDWGSVTEEEYVAECAAVVAELAPKLQNEILLSSGQHQHLIGRLERTVRRAVRRLVEFDRVSKFKPLALEKPFGRGANSLPPLVYKLPDGTELEVAGQIDRIDSAQSDGQFYILVIDYKSGGAWLKLIDVYHGLKLQLMTYLLVAQSAVTELLHCEECQPAGVLYYFLKNPTLSHPVMLTPEEAIKKLNDKLKMPGWTLSDPNVIQLVDSSIDGRSDFLKVGLKKSGELYAGSQAYVKTADEFNSLLAYTEKLLVDTAEEIMAGEIAISPYALGQHSACAVCRYSPVCQFDQLLPENTFRQLAQPDEQTVMQQLTGEKGDKD